MKLAAFVIAVLVLYAVAVNVFGAYLMTGSF